MIFKETPIEGAFSVEPERITDERGYFTRIFCVEGYRRHGLNGEVAQASVSYSTTEGTLRGMHYQASPHGECKLVRCLRGAVWDVIVDVRRESPTYREWWAAELNPTDATMLYLPEGLLTAF